MEFDRRRIAIIGIGLLVIAGAIGGYYWYQSKKTPPLPVVPGTVIPSSSGTKTPVQPATGGTIPSVTTPVAPAPTPVDATETVLKQAARFFVERFGSYSTQNPDGRVSDLLAYVTPSMASWLKTQEIKQTVEYTGATARVITNAISKKTDTAATVLIGVQIEETKSGKTTVSYKKGRVDLKKSGDIWLVDGFYWDK